LLGQLYYQIVQVYKDGLNGSIVFLVIKADVPAIALATEACTATDLEYMPFRWQQCDPWLCAKIAQWYAFASLLLPTSRIVLGDCALSSCSVEKKNEFR
jgi:hypothetical protein